MNKKALIFAFIGILLLTTLISTASAASTNEKDSAVGGGAFIHEEEGVPHTHPFAFSVQENRNQLQGTFILICKSGSQIDIMIKSTKITSLSIQPVQGGLAAVFTGSAMVKMDNGLWQNGWTFTVTAYDLDGAGADMIGVTLFNPQGQVHCSAEPTPLNSGNIIIKT